MIPASTYRAPSDLIVNDHIPRRAIAVGTCLINQGVLSVFPKVDNGCAVDHVLFNNASELPDKLPSPIGEYDLQMVQIPLSLIMRHGEFAKIPFHDIEAHQAVLEEAKSRLAMFLQLSMKYNELHGIYTVVWNFQRPQHNYNGRLLKKYDVRNTSYVIDILNRELENLVFGYKNANIFDFDELTSTLGKRYFQDDILYDQNNMGAIGNGDYEFDKSRIVTPTSVDELFSPRLFEFYEAAWNEILAMYRCARSADAIKMVVFDLDDTLWRGVLAERMDDVEALERAPVGWPRGWRKPFIY